MKEFCSRDQFRLYKLIWERFVASQMTSAVLDTMTVDLTVGTAVFRAVGSKVKFQGFMKIYVEGNDDGATEEEKFLPPLAVSDIATARSSRSEAAFYPAASTLFRSTSRAHDGGSWHWQAKYVCTYARNDSKAWIRSYGREEIFPH